MRTLPAFTFRRVIPLLALLATLAFLGGCANSGPSSGKGYLEKGKASYYGQKFHGRTTASGEPFNMHKMTCAHPSLPFGTKLRVTNLSNGKEVVVRVNDRGPHSGSRIIDLSKGAAKRIGMVRQGIAQVSVAKVR